MEDHNSEWDDSMLPPLVQIQVVDPTDDKDITRESLLNKESDNDVTTQFADVEIPQCLQNEYKM